MPTDHAPCTLTDNDLQALVARVRGRPRKGRLLSGWGGCVTGLIDAMGIRMGAELTPEFYAAAERVRGIWDGCGAV